MPSALGRSRRRPCDYRSGLARAIAARSEFDLVGVAADASTARALIERDRPDLALLDVRLSGLDGYVISELLAAHEPPVATRTVLMSAIVDRAQVARALRVGALGPLTKDESRDEICDALLAAACVGGGRRQVLQHRHAGEHADSGDRR